MIHLLDIRMAQEDLGWQLGRQRIILPPLIGNIPMALQHRQKRPFKGLEMTVLQEVAL